MRSRWIEEITARAAARWPAERRRTVLGERNLLLPVVEAAPLLRVLGLLNGDGDMSRDAVRKYLQINHMVALLEPVFRDLMRAHETVRVLDVACGSSFLTLLLAWCFEHRWFHACQILGVDRNDAVVQRSRSRAADAGLDHSLAFHAATIGSLDTGDVWSGAFDEPRGTGDIHAVVALHACDTATDEALALGVDLEAEFIGAAPCCQAELAQAWASLADGAAEGPFAPLWSSPHLRREAAATLTDALRTLLLRSRGYQVTAMEFVSSAHTPKNTLIRARRDAAEDGVRARRDYRDLRDSIGGTSIRLEDLLGRIPVTPASR